MFQIITLFMRFVSHYHHLMVEGHNTQIQPQLSGTNWILQAVHAFNFTPVLFEFCFTTDDSEARQPTPYHYSTAKWLTISLGQRVGCRACSQGRQLRLQGLQPRLCLFRLVPVGLVVFQQPLPAVDHLLAQDVQQLIPTYTTAVSLDKNGMAKHKVFYQTCKNVLVPGYLNFFCNCVPYV